MAKSASHGTQNAAGGEKRGRGRPKSFKTIEKEQKLASGEIVKKGRGRPKSAKRIAKETAIKLGYEVQRGRGRPKGSGLKVQMSEAAKAANQAKKAQSLAREKSIISTVAMNKGKVGVYKTGAGGQAKIEAAGNVLLKTRTRQGVRHGQPYSVEIFSKAKLNERFKDVHTTAKYGGEASGHTVERPKIGMMSGKEIVTKHAGGRPLETFYREKKGGTAYKNASFWMGTSLSGEPSKHLKDGPGHQTTQSSVARIRNVKHLIGGRGSAHKGGRYK